MKKFLGIIIVISLIVFIVPSKVDAITLSSVNSKIDELEKMFPTGSYFTTTGTNSCSKNVVYESNYSYCYSMSCSSCKLGNVLQQNSKAKNTIVPAVCLRGERYSCCGFATFVFCYIFEHDPDINVSTISSSNYGGINASFLSSLKKGDFLVCNNGEHYAIFLGYDSNYIYLYESNYDSPNQVEYNHKRAWNRWSKITAYRSNTYGDNIAVKDYYKLTSPDGVQTMRSSYSTSSSAIIDIPAGNYVCVTQYSPDGNWGYVSYNGKSGWIRLYYVEKHNSHTYSSWSTTKAATCTNTGTKTRSCACGVSETETIAALGHNYSTSWTVDKAANCTVAGSKSRHCTRCQSTKDVTTIPATGHSYGNWIITKAATCSDIGTKNRSCSCGNKETANINALGHKYLTEWTIDKAATVKECGSKSYHCSRCDAKKDITTIPAIGGWEFLEGKWSYYNYVGEKVKGWLQLGNTWYYMNSEGVMQTGWLKEGNTWYYLTSSGAMATGWAKVNGTYYYFNSSGAMQTGWVKSGITWYYLKSSGAMATGWEKVNGAYYYFNQSGAMQTGWIKSGSTWYYLKDSGAMATGWAKVNGTYYYFNSSGAMQTGWLKLGNAWYYLKDSGAMATGTLKIGGTTYKFSSSGAWIA